MSQSDPSPRIVHTAVDGPMAAVYLWFEAGTIDEAEGEHGAAHLLEHMLFKGTRSHGVGEVAAAIEALGGDLNAYTVWDQTVLHANVLAENWKPALEVLAEMAWHSLLDPEELEREKGVVIEEIRGYADDPQSVLDDRLMEDLFPAHGYGRPVLGTEESVLAIDRDRLHGFWRRHYGAERCVVGVAGPMEREEVEAAVQGFEIPAAQERPRIADLPLADVGIERVEGDFETPLITLGFRCAGGSERDVAVVEVLAQVLGGGRASLLEREVRVRDKLVSDIGCSSYARRSGGTLEVGMQPFDPQAAYESVLAVLDRAKLGLGTGAVERAKANLLSDHAYTAQTVDSVAHDAVWFASRHGDPQGRERWNDILARVTAADVNRVAREILQNPVVRTLGCTVNPTTLEPVPDERSTVWKSGRDDGWARQGAIASVYIAMPGGRLYEPAQRAGLADAWATLLTCGAGPYDSVQLAAELERIAGSIRAIGGRNTLGLQLTVPSIDLPRGLELMQHLVQDPHFARTEWDRTRGEYLQDLDTLNDRPDEVLGRRLATLAFPDHPWGRVLTKTTLRAITPGAIRQFHLDHLGHGIRVGVAGDIQDGWLADLQVPDHPLQMHVPPMVPLQTGRFNSKAGHQQALLVRAWRTVGIPHPDLPVLSIATAVLGAQSGRLFMDLREERSLAYHVWAHRREGLGGGLFSIGLATDPERIREARTQLLATFDLLREEGPSQAELERAIQMRIGQISSSHQRASSRAAHLALSQIYGMKPGLAVAREQLRGVTVERVRDVLQGLPEGLELTVRP